MVLVEGIEPTRPCGHRILSPARLPVPPHQREADYTGIAARYSSEAGAKCANMAMGRWHTQCELPINADTRSRSGHMIYLNEKEVPNLKANVATFIDEAAKP